MGMSASQARLLFITSRMNDIELKSQQISNTKMRLADESEQVANAYTTALNKTRLQVTDPLTSTSSQLTYNSIMSPNGLMSGGYNLQTIDGKVVVSHDVAAAFEKSRGKSYAPEDISAYKIDYLEALKGLNDAKTTLYDYLTEKNVSVNNDGTLKFPTYTETPSKVTSSTGEASGAKGGGSVPTTDGTSSAGGAGGVGGAGKVGTAEGTSSAGGAGGTSGVGGAGKVGTAEGTSSAGGASGTGGSTRVGTAEGTSSAGGTGGGSKIVSVYSDAEKNQIQKQYLEMLNNISLAEQNVKATEEAMDAAVAKNNSINANLGDYSSDFYQNLFKQMETNGYQAYDQKLLNNPEALQTFLSNGDWYLGKKDSDGKYAQTSISSSTMITEVTDKTDMAKAEAEYNAKTLKINNKEKKLDNQLKNLDTEHSALKTEQDSIKSLIKDNVDKSFNLFS